MITMRTLYIRNVPDDVASDVEALAAAEGLSVNAFVVRELTWAARRAGNARLLADLPEITIDIDEVIDDIHAGRPER
jgi:hypothetical protein